VRKKAYSAAIQRITEQAYWQPLHTYVTTYGYAKQLDFTPYPDELPRFFWRSGSRTVSQRRGPAQAAPLDVTCRRLRASAPTGRDLPIVRKYGRRHRVAGRLA
jgi:hypothetical protein